MTNSDKLTFEDIMRLDAERTQDVTSICLEYVVANGKMTLGFGDSDYYTAMPQAVGMLREYRGELESIGNQLQMARTEKTSKHILQRIQIILDELQRLLQEGEG